MANIRVAIKCEITVDRVSCDTKDWIMHTSKCGVFKLEWLGCKPIR